VRGMGRTMQGRFHRLVWGLLTLALTVGIPNGWTGQKSSKAPVAHPADQLSKGDKVTLAELVKAALERNTSIQASEQSAQAKRSRIPAERTLPDPTVSFQTMGDPFPFNLQEGDPSSGRFYGVEQEIPFPGKLGLKGQIAEKEADVQQWNSEQTRRQVVSEVKRAYYDYVLVHKSLDIVEESKGLLDSFAQVAEAKYRVGQGTQQDVLKAQVEISKLVDRHEVLEQRRIIARALINSLISRPVESPLGQPEDNPQNAVQYSLEELQQIARGNAPVLKMQESEVERNEENVKLAKKQYYPDFSLGFTYVQRDDMPEMYGVTVKAKVPLYFWRKQRLELKSARESLAGAERLHDNAATTLEYNVRDGYTVASTSRRLAELYKTTVIPQASLSVESSFASYQVGQVDFLSLLDSVMTLLEYQLKYHESVSEYRRALAQLEPLVGVELTN
jgi:outer membrane protein, heavy metal efflux system